MSNELRLLVIGLDGATFDIIKPLIARGRLPVLARLIAGGASGPLRSTIPPVSAPAWSTFMTGLNPGKHGIFQWRTYDPHKYTCLDEHLMTSARLAGRTFWDILGNSGYRVAVITVPMTYPVWPVNGLMVAGYPCPDARRNYTYPREWAEDLEEPYNFPADYYLHAPPEAIRRLGPQMLERRTSLAIKLIKEEHVHICVVVLGEIDRAQHDFWQYADARFPAHYTPQGELYRRVIEEHYEVADAQVGRMLELTGSETLVVIMSDHGGGPHPPKLFRTNAWLRGMGWLTLGQGSVARHGEIMRTALGLLRRKFPFEERLRRWLPDYVVNRVRGLSLDIAGIDWARTRAYRFPMYHPVEGIEINLRGRQPQGTVEPGAEFRALREEIVNALRELRDPDSGARIVHTVYRSEELYNGPYLSIAPDIVFITAPDYKAEAGLAGGFVAPAPLAGLDKNSGVHTMDGIIIAHGSAVRRSYSVSGMEIADIAPTLLYALGEAVPEGMDGRVRSDIFNPSWAICHQVRYQRMEATELVPETGLSAEEEAQICDKLRGLGYIE